MEPHHNGSVAWQRIVASEEQMLAIVEEYEASDFTPKDFCGVTDTRRDRTARIRFCKVVCNYIAVTNTNSINR